MLHVIITNRNSRKYIWFLNNSTTYTFILVNWIRSTIYIFNIRCSLSYIVCEILQPSKIIRQIYTREIILNSYLHFIVFS